MVSYAYRGSAGGPDTYDSTGATEHHYPQPGPHGIEFAKPRPAHTQTPEALAAVEDVRRYGRRLRLEREIAELVTDHGNPHVEPYAGEVVTAAAKRLLAAAQGKGMTAQIVESAAACCVEAIAADRSFAFRAWWSRGRAAGGTWHEPRDRWTLVADTRPIRMDAKTHTGLKGYRTAGQGTTRLVPVALRAGLPMNITEIEKRVKAL